MDLLIFSSKFINIIIIKSLAKHINNFLLVKSTLKVCRNALEDVNIMKIV